MTLAQYLDSVVRDRVLVFGSLPPSGRDIDLLARPAELRAIADKLRADGFLSCGERWVLFQHCTSEVIELIPSEAWDLPLEEVRALFAEARPLDGLKRLVRPAPHHVLLIAARRLVRTGDFSEKQRARVEAAHAEDSRCWRVAAERSASWGAEAALVLLRRALDGNTAVQTSERAHASIREFHSSSARISSASFRVLRAVAAPLHRGTVVSISGCDGAGKSSQAAALQEALAQAGFDAVVVWSPLGQFPFLQAIGVPIKKLLSVFRLGPFRHGADQAEVQSIMSTRRDSSSLVGGLFKNLWVTVIAFLNGLSQRRAVASHLFRGRVVILDRSTLDAIVLIRFLYGEGHEFRFQRWLLRTLSPRVSLSYFLDVSPETLLARKQDWWTLSDLQRHALLFRAECGRFGVRHLDGELPPDRLCTMIATETWLTVTGSTRRRTDQPSRSG